LRERLQRDVEERGKERRGGVRGSREGWKEKYQKATERERQRAKEVEGEKIQNLSHFLPLLCMCAYVCDIMSDCERSKLVLLNLKL